MRARITKLMAAFMAVGVLAVGGASLASAAGKSSSEPPAAAVDSDAIQSGDQTSPDTGLAGESAPSELSSESSSEASSDGPGGHADDSSNSSVDYQFEGVQ